MTDYWARKANLSDDDVHEIMDTLFGVIPADRGRIGVQSEPCPYCWVESGPCVTRSGNRYAYYHAARWDVRSGRRPRPFLIREEPW